MDLSRRLAAGLAAAAALAGAALASSAPAATPCTITFDGGPAGTGDDWGGAANWSTDALPGAADHVCIPAGRAVTSDDSTTIRSLQVDGALTRTGGQLVLTDTEPSDIVGSLELAGGYVYLGPGAALVNSGTLAASTNGGVYPWGGAGAQPLVRNTGTITTRAGTTSTTIAVPVDNDGLVRAPAGELRLLSGSPADGASTGRIGEDGDAGEVVLDAGTFALGDGAALRGSVALLGATARLDADVPQSGALRVGSGGVVSGPGTLRIGGDVTLAGGTLGDADVADGASLTLTGNSTQQLASDRTLRNRGTTTLAGGTLYLHPGASLDNEGDLALTGSDGVSIRRWTSSGGAPALRNRGTLRRAEAAGAATIAVPLDNDGAVRAETGTLLLHEGGIADDVSTGSFGRDGDGGQVSFESGVYRLAGASTLRDDVRLSGADLDLQEDVAQAGAFLLERGTLSGPGRLEVSGAMTATAGTLGDVAVAETASLALSGAGTRYVAAGRTLHNAGALSMTGGSLYAEPGAMVVNDGTFVASGAADTGIHRTTSAGAEPSLRNTGTFRRGTGNATTTISVPVENDGSLRAQEGTIAMSDGTPEGATAVGDYGDPADAGTIRFAGGAFALGAGTALADAVEVSGATLTLGADVPQTGALRLDNGATVTGPGALIAAGAIAVTNGTLGATTVASGGSLAMQAGTLGSTSIAEGATLAFTGAQTRWLADGAAVTNAGAVTMDSGTIYFGAGATLENAGAFAISGAGDTGMYPWSSSGAEPAIRNTGTLRRSGGTGTTTISVPFENDGIARAPAGTLAMSGGTPAEAVATGDYGDAADAGTIRFDSGRFAMGGGTSLNDDVDVGSATLDLGADVPQAGALDITGGGAITGPGALDAAGALRVVNGDLATTRLTTGASLAMQAGTLGTTTVEAGASLAFTGNHTRRLADGATLSTAAPTSMDGGTLYLGAGTTVENSGAWSFSGATDSGVHRWSSSGVEPVFRNTGTLRRSAGSGTTTINVDVDNDGAVRAQAGTLALNGGTPPGAVATGDYGDAADAGAVRFTSGIFALGDGASLNDDVDVSAATLDLAADLPQTGTLDLTNGGALSGPGALRAAGAVSVVNGTLGTTVLTSGASLSMQAGVLGSTTVPAGATLAFTGNQTRTLSDGAVLATAGPATMDGGTLYLGPATSVANSGVWSFSGPADSALQRWSSSGAEPMFRNTGTVRRSAGTATTTIGVPLDNDGTVRALAGALSLSASSPAPPVSTGAYGVDGDGGRVVFSGGSHAFGGGASLADDVDASNAQLRLDADVPQRGTLDLAGTTTGGPGVLRLEGAVTFTSGELGNVAVADTGTLAFRTNTSRTLDEGRTLRNDGVVTVEAGTLYLDRGAALENAGTLRFTGAGDTGLHRWTSFGTDPVLRNTGELRRGTGGGTTTISVPTGNDGALRADSGILALTGGTLTGAAATGVYGAAGDAGVVRFGGGDHVLATGASVAGKVELTGGALDIAGATELQELSQSSGTLRGAGTVTVAGPLRWTGGTMAGQGVTRIPAGGTLTMTGFGGREVDGTRTLRIEGAGSLDEGWLTLSGNGRLENRGIFNVNGAGSGVNAAWQSTGGMYNAPGATLRKASGATESTIAAPLDNDGTVRALSGTLALSGDAGAPSAGAFGVAGDAGTVAFTGGVQRLETGAALGGRLELRSGELDVDGFVRHVGDVLLASGRITGTGTLVLGAGGGAVTAQSTSMSGPGTTRIADGATLRVTQHLQIDDRRTLRTDGAVELRGSVYVGDQSTWDQRGAVAVEQGGSVSGQSWGTPGLLYNGGAIRKVAGGDMWFDVPVLNDGVLEVRRGILNVSDDFRQSRDGRLRLILGDPAVPGESGRLNASFSRIRLNGTLETALADGYAAKAGDAWTLVTHGIRDGEFAAVDGAAFGNGVAGAVEYGTQEVRMSANAVLSALRVKGAGPTGSVPVDEPMTYTFVVASDGPDTAPAVRLTDDLPDDVRLVSATAEKGHCGGTQTLHCDLGSIAPGQAVEVTATLRAEGPGDVSHTASVVSAAADADRSDDSVTFQLLATGDAAKADAVAPPADEPSPEGEPSPSPSPALSGTVTPEPTDGGSLAPAAPPAPGPRAVAPPRPATGGAEAPGVSRAVRKPRRAARRCRPAARTGRAAVPASRKTAAGRAAARRCRAPQRSIARRPGTMEARRELARGRG